ncbi:MAG: ATP-binding cassette domain-containing protein [Calditrichaceae bacterium]|nr:ATP-binding cassette domain-containing protein [Calditrichaceae bacterium]MBN2710172.1 ATP-binding cassette domain-containing protein [Calditrichaceae bacterium]RQV94148.1 MAG: ATP-binding cassette domain-containing protein [Calditrichota bacterium]
MKILEVENITKKFGDYVAVNSVSLKAEKGKILGVLGPNGAGKTTTIRMIMDIIAPDSGTITFNNGLSKESMKDRIGYLPEERGLYKKMKIDELLRFQGRLKSLSGKEADRRADMWLERMEITDWKKKKVEELSKGMQQKIQFIGTIFHNPDLLILDEPFGGLDPINANLIKDIILELKKQGAAILFSTHIMESAEKLCDEIILINKGELILSGPLSKVKEQFNKNNILLDYTGPDGFLNENAMIYKYNNYGNHVEIELNEHIKPQDFLKKIIDRVEIRKFELREPSLNDIFIEAVGKKNNGDRV